MLSKGIMVLALLALVYLLLITMNNKPTENFEALNNSPKSANSRPRNVMQNPSSVRKVNPAPVRAPAAPVRAPAAPVRAPAAPVRAPAAPVRAPVAPRSSNYIAPVTEDFTQEPVINYQENFEEEEEEEEEDDVVQDMSKLMINREEAEELNIQFTNNFYQDSKKGKNIKNPVLDVRGECEITFNSNFTPFNSSAIAGEPLRDVTLLQDNVDVNCKRTPGSV